MFRRLLPIAAVVLVSLAGCGAAAGSTGAPAAGATGATPSGGAGSPAAASAVPAKGGSTGASAPALTGTQHAYLTAVDPAKATITFDLVEWFEGAQAAAACKEDGETETANDRCRGYYFRNKSHQLRTLPVKRGAPLQVLVEGARPGPADLAGVRAAASARHSLWKLEVAGGEITAAEEIYLP